MSTSYGPPYCPVCKAYMWTTDISNRYRCHCLTENDIKSYYDTVVAELKKTRVYTQEKEEKQSD